MSGEALGLVLLEHNRLALNECQEVAVQAILLGDEQPMRTALVHGEARLPVIACEVLRPNKSSGAD